MKRWATPRIARNCATKYLPGLGLVACFGLNGCAQYNITGTLAGHDMRAADVQIFNNGQFSALMHQNGVFTLRTSSTTYSITGGDPDETCYVNNGSNTLVVNGPWSNLNPPATQPIEINCNWNLPTPGPTWTQLSNQPSGPIDLMLLLSDGSVMAHSSATYTTWYRLTPDAYGHYVNGTWSTLHSSLCPHDQFASQVLHDGRVFVAGGELPSPSGISGCAQTGQSDTGVDTEIYDPTSDSWTAADPPSSNPDLIDPQASPGNPTVCQYPTSSPPLDKQGFIDMTSALLDDGRVLMAPVCPKSCGDTLIFDPTAFDSTKVGSGWSFAGTLANTTNNSAGAATQYSCSEQETSWVKLQDGSILTADPPSNPGVNQTSERFAPGTSQWVADQNLNFSLFNTEYGWSPDGEEGPAFLLPSGEAVFVGASGILGTYTPAANGMPSSWRQDQLLLGGPATAGAVLGAADKPGVMMANGKILLALNFLSTPASSGYDGNAFPAPVFFYEYDPSQPFNNAFTEVPGPGLAWNPWSDCSGGSDNVYFNLMLPLPDGTVLMPSNCPLTNQRSTVFVYTSGGPPLFQGQPVIDTGLLRGVAAGANVTQLSPNRFSITGTGFTGISEGASYGDDAQMASNYPLIRLTDVTGRVTYARSHDWKSSGVIENAPGGYAEFDVPWLLPLGDYFLSVVVNGNASGPVVFHWCPPPFSWNMQLVACT